MRQKTLPNRVLTWFHLERRRILLHLTAILWLTASAALGAENCRVVVDSGAQKWRALEDGLPSVLKERRWFGAKGKTIASVKVTDSFTLTQSGRLAIIEVKYSEGVSEQYLLPLTELPDGKGFADGAQDPELARALVGAVITGQSIKGSANGVVLKGTRIGTAPFTPESLSALEVSPLAGEQSNTSFFVGKLAMFKLVRRLESGINPDFEITRFLTERTGFRNAPQVIGQLVVERADGSRIDVGVSQNFIVSHGDGWSASLKSIKSQLAEAPSAGFESASFKSYLKDVELLAKRTAEMHLALESGTSNPDFAPESITRAWQDKLKAKLEAEVKESLQLLSSNIGKLEEGARAEAERIIQQGSKLTDRLKWLGEGLLSASRIRAHNDYHLGQVLKTANDYIILDFEGEPARPLAERRHKVSPICDVAGMIRSFHYAINFEFMRMGSPAHLQSFVDGWYSQVAKIFWDSYRRAAEGGSFLPKNPEQAQALLDLFLLEKTVYEMKYELNNRPDWAGIPIRGLLGFL